MKFKAIVLGVAVAFSALGACATPADAWTQIGTREVRDRTERDTFSLPSPRRFDRIKLCVYRNPVHFIDLDVRYANGTRQDVSVRSRINAGQCTRAIDLVGNDRNITSVSMVYEETSFRRRTATVRLLAE